jgi:hypothetical protein
MSGPASDVCAGESGGWHWRGIRAVDRGFAVALRGVGVAGRERCAGVQDRKIESGAAREFTDVHIAAADACAEGDGGSSASESVRRRDGVRA